MQTRHAQQMLKTARLLRSHLVAIVTSIDDLCHLLEHDSDFPTSGERAECQTEVHLDRSTFEVRYRGQRCALGATMGFRVLERLARRPNQYIHADALLEELWTAPRSYVTVRSTVCRLKARLRRAGLGEVADMIDGRTRGHYGLISLGR